MKNLRTASVVFAVVTGLVMGACTATTVAPTVSTESTVAVGRSRTAVPVAASTVASLSPVAVPQSLSCPHWTCDGSSYASTRAQCQAVCGPGNPCYYDPYCT
jgi:hypothetical protein